jgi:hypothetical protein
MTNDGSIVIMEALGKHFILTYHLYLTIFYFMLYLLLCVLWLLLLLNLSFILIGRVDPSIIDAVGIENLVQYHIWSMEQLEAKWFKMVEEKGYWTGFVMFEDLGGLGWHSLSSKVLAVCVYSYYNLPSLLPLLLIF